MRRGPSRATLVGALALFGWAASLGAQQRSDEVSTRPDRWFVSTTTDQATREPTLRMLYLGRDGTVLIVQCAAREGQRTGGWTFVVRRDDWTFANEFVNGWWSVDSEPVVGPLQWGGAGSLVMLNEDALRDRLQEPVAERIRLVVARGTSQWTLELAPSDLASSVEQFAPSCRTT